MDIILNVAILVIQVVGFVLGAVVVYRLKQQIVALKGTVETQKATLETVGELNKIALAMARAFDPKKYSEHMKVYEELVERNAAEAVEDARRALAREHQQTKAKHEEALQAGLALVAYIPPDRRQQAITDVPLDLRATYQGMAEKAPDLSCLPMRRLGLADFDGVYRQMLASTLQV